MHSIFIGDGRVCNVCFLFIFRWFEPRNVEDVTLLREYCERENDTNFFREKYGF